MKIVATIFLLAVSVLPTYAQRYRITDLGILPGGTYSQAAGVNNLGHVAGTADAYVNIGEKGPKMRGQEAFFWRNGKMQDIGQHSLLPTAGIAINDRDQIVGSAMDTCGYTSGAWNMNSKLPLQPCPISGGYGCSYAINNLGQSAGEQHDYYMSRGRSHPFADGQVLENAKPGQNIMELPIEEAEATGINDDGLVVGSADLSAKPGSQPHHAVLWRKGVRQDLGTLGGTESRAYAVNNLGQIVGASSILAPQGTDTILYHGFLWQNNKMLDLGTLPGDKQSSATAIHVRGEIVGFSGERGCLWRNGKPIDLNTLILTSLGWIIQGASGINDHGQIVGSGLHHGKLRAYLMTPRS